MNKGTFTYFYYHTPHGTLTIGVCPDGVRLIHFGVIETVGVKRASALANHVSTEILEYLAGKRRSFDVPLVFEGSAFQRQVWEELLRIPYGHTRTSSQIAAALGCPNAYRAVGAAIRANPLAIIVPDHRVVRADGRPLSPDARGRVRAALLQAERARIAHTQN